MSISNIRDNKIPIQRKWESSITFINETMWLPSSLEQSFRQRITQDGRIELEQHNKKGIYPGGSPFYIDKVHLNTGKI